MPIKTTLVNSKTEKGFWESPLYAATKVRSNHHECTLNLELSHSPAFRDCLYQRHCPSLRRICCNERCANALHRLLWWSLAGTLITLLYSPLMPLNYKFSVEVRNRRYYKALAGSYDDSRRNQQKTQGQPIRFRGDGKLTFQTVAKSSQKSGIRSKSDPWLHRGGLLYLGSLRLARMYGVGPTSSPRKQ